MSLTNNLPGMSPVLARAVVNEASRRDLVRFLARVFEVVAPGEELHLNWHIHAMAHALEGVRTGKTKRLIITLPPRSLKSILASVAFPAFVLGHDPTKKIICASYSIELAIKHANDMRTVVRSPFYQRMFPHMRLKLVKDSETELITTKRGGRLTTSVGGTLTGRGGNIIIIDDPMKPDEAMSETSRANVIRWFETTLLSRLNSKSEDAIIVIMQRLHVDDLAGALLERGGWEHLDLPAIADSPEDVQIGGGLVHHRDPGEVLDPIREPLGVLIRMKASMGSMAFSAQYLQRPVPAEGNLIKREWLRFSDLPSPGKSRDLVIASWDTALKATELSDYSVGTVWLVRGETCYLLDLVRARLEYPALKRAVLEMRARWRVAHTLIEDKGSGTTLIQDLHRENVKVIPIKAETDKETRLYSVQGKFEAGSVIFPKNAPWLDDLRTELLGFPASRHDDQVDSISQALSWIIRRKPLLGAPIGMPIQVF
jgi:predicted phage terminase large subunit-like protein